MDLETRVRDHFAESIRSKQAAQAELTEDERVLSQFYDNVLRGLQQAYMEDDLPALKAQIAASGSLGRRSCSLPALIPGWAASCRPLIKAFSELAHA